MIKYKLKWNDTNKLNRNDKHKLNPNGKYKLKMGKNHNDKYKLKYTFFFNQCDNMKIT